MCGTIFQGKLRVNIQLTQEGTSRVFQGEYDKIEFLIDTEEASELVGLLTTDFIIVRGNSYLSNMFEWAEVQDLTLTPVPYDYKPEQTVLGTFYASEYHEV